MPLFTRRALSAGEIALGRSMFGEDIKWPKVRIAQLPPLPFGAMVPLGRTIVFARWRAPHDFAHAPQSVQGWFIHELTHVWQAARGIVLARAKLNALGAKAYHVHWRDGARLGDFNIEAQAEIARFVFLARAGAETPIARAELERIWKTGLKG